MKTAAIIAEYNPFHNGHAYQISELRNKHGVTHVIAIMNASFMQRGGPAIFDKLQRCNAALQCGADLVLELPYVYGAQTAEIFAYGGVGIAALCSADILSFGCETPELAAFHKIVPLLRHENTEYRQSLRQYLNDGFSYAQSRIKSLEQLSGSDLAFLKLPNNILALEYLRAIDRIGQPLPVIPIPRKGIAYYETGVNNGYASASFLRSELSDGNLKSVQSAVPYPLEFSAKELAKHLHSSDDYRFPIKAALLDTKELSVLPDYETGMENRFAQSLPFLNDGVETFVAQVSTKRYTKSRIRRMLFNLLMDYTAEDMFFYRDHLPGYLRILGTNHKGRELINQIKATHRVLAVSNLSKEIEQFSAEDRKIAQTERKASALFHLYDDSYCDDYSLKPIIRDESHGDISC